MLELPVEWTEDLTLIKKQFRKISLSVHPDKNTHPQADAAFRKVYGAFETLSDMGQQRKLLFTLGIGEASEAEKARFEAAGAEDDDDAVFQWWWEASVPQVEKAAEEAEGGRFDSFAAAYVSDGLGGDVNDVKWMGLKKALALHAKGRVLFIDCREAADYNGGMIPGAFHVPMSAVQHWGVVNALQAAGNDLIHQILSTRRHQLIIIYSNVRHGHPRPHAWRHRRAPRQCATLLMPTTRSCCTNSRACHHPSHPNRVWLIMVRRSRRLFRAVAPFAAGCCVLGTKRCLPLASADCVAESSAGCTSRGRLHDH